MVCLHMTRSSREVLLAGSLDLTSVSPAKPASHASSASTAWTSP